MNVRRSRQRFNEAAGFTRRKPAPPATQRRTGCQRFNEATGFTRRKRSGRRFVPCKLHWASMRPPDLPGGNGSQCRRNQRRGRASMRPPDLPGGNLAIKLGAEAAAVMLQ